MVLIVCSAQDLNENADEKNPDEEEAFQGTEWIDITEGFSIRQQKKVNLMFIKSKMM